MSNLLKKLNPTNSSLYEKVEAQVKQASYSIMHELLQRQINSLFFFLILVVIEGFQLLWFSLHPNFSFLWTTSFVDYYRLVLKYLQADSFLLDGDQGFYFAFLYIAGVVQVSMIVCVIFVLTRPEKIRKKPSSLLDYVYRYMSIYCLLVKTIAPLPFFETFLFAIICTDNDPLRSPGTCYTGVHLFNLAVGIIGFISLLIFSFATQLLYIDLNPYSNILFASPHPRLELLKLFLKLAVPLYIVLDPTLEDAKAFVVIYVICWIVILTLRYNLQAYYNGIVSLFCISVEGIVFWAVSVANFHAFLDSGTVDAIGLVYYLIGIPFVMYTYAMILNLKRHQIMKKDSKTFKKPREIELYINILCQALEQREHPIKRVQLEGLLRYHMKYCNNRGPDCPCQLITAMLPRKEENPESLNLWHSFIKVRIIEALEMFPKSQRLHLQYAYFQKERLKNKFRALFELMIADENEPGVQQQFSIYRYKRLIEKEMLDEEHRNITGKVADITQIVEFQDKLVTLQNDIGKTVVGQLEFWRELEQANPNIQKLLSLGEKVTIQIENIKLAYGKLHELNPNHIKLLLTYGNFVKNVLNDITEGQRILEKADYVKRSMQANANFLGNDLMKYEGDTETCIVTCSANLHSLGNILNISAEIQRILQYTNSDLIGQSINQMMPNMIARLHDDFMRNYFETSKSVRVGRETVIYPMNKPGYIVPCAITVKVIPNLSDGLKMVGFLNELSQGKPSNPQEKGLSSFSSSAGYNKMHYILYGGENNVVHGVTESCFQSFGISSSLTLAQNIDFSEFTIDKIFPDLLLQNTQELRTGGLILKINTTALAQEYLAAKNSALLEEEDEATVQKRYREARVRVSLIEENVYDGGITLNIIKFAEFSDEVQISSKQEIAMPTSPGQIALKGKTIAAQGIDMNASQSDMSASSMSVVANEEDLILKDLKHQISAKKSPNVIIVLNRVSLLGAILLIVLMGLQLNKQTNNNDELKTALHVTRLSNERYNIIAELTLKVQMLDLLANNMISNANTIEQNEAELRYEIGTLVDQLSVVQFTTIQGRIDMQKENGEAVPSYSVQALLEDDTIADLVESYTNAVWVYVGAVQKVNNLALDALKDPIANYSVKDLLFYIKTNGLGVLQEGSETLTDSFIDFYASQTNSYIEFFLITSIIAFVLVLLFVLFVLFKIFSVNRTNIRVLSLFGYIPPNDIRELIDKCLQYLDAHQADIMVTEKNESYSEIQQEDQEKAVPTDKAEPSGLDDSKEVHSSRCEPIETEQDKGFDKTGDLMIQTQKQLHDRTIFETALEQSRSSLPLVTNAYPKDVNTTFGALENNKKPKRAESQDDKQDELLEELHEKSKNLANSKEYQKRGVIIQILIVCAIPTVYFALSLWLKIQSVDIFHSALDHMGVISEITVNLYYTTLFCLEEIIDPESLGSSISTSKASDEQSRQDFKQRVYANQQSLKSTGSLFPSQMDDYVTELTNFNNDDTCTLLYAEDPSQLAQCQSVDGSPYTGGLIQRELRLLDANDYALTKYFAVANRTVQTQIDMINGDNIQLTFQMIDRIDPAATEILDSFEASYSDCLHSMYVLAEIVSAVFAVVIFVILLFVWLPYLRRLTKQIIRTKSLMNVIPIQPLKKNKGLKEAFTSAGILAAMR